MRPARALLALAPLLAAVSCGNGPRPDLTGGPSPQFKIDSDMRFTVAAPVAERNEADEGMRGYRICAELRTREEWTVHFAGTVLATRERDYVDDNGETWDDALFGPGFGARRWWFAGPLQLGVGAEFGYGRPLDSADDFVFAAGMLTARCDFPLVDPVAVGLEADLHYRAPIGISGPSTSDDTRAHDAFRGWVLFVGGSVSF